MKLNWSFFIKTALTTIFFASATLSAQSKEIINYAQYQSRESQGEMIAVSTADSDDYNQIVESPDQEFSSKQNLSGELALAILLITVCQLVQYSCQSQSTKQAKFNEPNQLEHRYLFVGLGLGSFYQSVNSNQRSNRFVKKAIRVPRTKKTTQAKI